MAIHALSELANVRRLVVKIGSALLVEQGRPRAYWLSSLAQDIHALRETGVEVIVVSSGAIALGAAKLGLAKGGRAVWPMRRPQHPWVRWNWRGCGPMCWASMKSPLHRCW